MKSEKRKTFFIEFQSKGKGNQLFRLIEIDKISSKNLVLIPLFSSRLEVQVEASQCGTE